MRRFGIVALLTTLLAGLAPAAAQAASPVGPWIPLGSDHARPLDESQGLATIVRPSGTTIRYTGVGTIPADVNSRGWNHVGDPGTAQGYYVEPYQRDDRGAKLFRVQAPNGTWSEYTHALESWEANNNSFSAVSPDGRWMVAGEWGTMNRLLVHPMPGIAFTTSGQNLPYAFAIRLNRPVRDIQGCDFTSATQLLCASDDPDGTLFGIKKPLLQVNLTSALSGSDVTGNVTALGQLPLESGCGGNFEVEGIDFDERDGTLRVIVMSPSICIAFDSKTWRFRR
jgi:opacity protein-like surface antigen